jgi:GT2 family glycosyltransferase
VVTLAHGRHEHLSGQHESLARGSRLPDDYLVVAMDDAGQRPRTRWQLRRQVVHRAAEPLGLPLAAARNQGARHALDLGADVLVFLDVDCLAGYDLVSSYAEAASEHRDTVWSGPVTYLPASAIGYAPDRLDLLDDPHPARPDPGRGRMVRGAEPDLFWSLSFALHRSAWHRIGGFCEEYVGYGGEDTDFGHQSVARGLTLGWCGDARAYHQWHEISSPPVEHLDDVLRNAAVFHRRWGRWPMEGWLRAFENQGLASCRDGRWVRTVKGARTMAS